MVGMIEWLLSDEGADCRQRTISRFVLMNSPDGPSNGWYRVNAQGVDMNRSYWPGGADRENQAHEAYIVQKDLEQIMASDAQATTLWSMHTRGGPVEPIQVCGPEFGDLLGPWQDLRETIEEHDPEGLIKPLAIREKAGNGALVPVAAKSGQTFHSDFNKELHWWQNTAHLTGPPGTVVYGGDSSTRYKNCTILSWRSWG